MPMAPIFSLKEVTPLAVPNNPAITHPMPSIQIPLLIACLGGESAPDKRAQA